MTRLCSLCWEFCREQKHFRKFQNPRDGGTPPRGWLFCARSRRGVWEPGGPSGSPRWRSCPWVERAGTPLCSHVPRLPCHGPAWGENLAAAFLCPNAFFREHLRFFREGFGFLFVLLLGYFLFSTWRQKCDFFSPWRQCIYCSGESPRDSYAPGRRSGSGPGKRTPARTWVLGGRAEWAALGPEGEAVCQQDSHGWRLLRAGGSKVLPQQDRVGGKHQGNNAPGPPGDSRPVLKFWTGPRGDSWRSPASQEGELLSHGPCSAGPEQPGPCFGTAAAARRGPRQSEALGDSGATPPPPRPLGFWWPQRHRQHTRTVLPAGSVASLVVRLQRTHTASRGKWGRSTVHPCCEAVFGPVGCGHVGLFPLCRAFGRSIGF